jgi:hypothetical protein
MDIEEGNDDVPAIRALVERQFASLAWSPDRPADWAAFAADFDPAASLYPAARPAKRQSVEAFVGRMQGLASTTLRSLHESVLGIEVRQFGNVAVAVVACELTENESTLSRTVEMLLLVKCEGAWRIVAQAWDAESPANPIPPQLLRPAGTRT